MICPMCNDTGKIGVNVVDKTTKTSTGEWRPCPLCSKAQAVSGGSGVSGNTSLEGSEQTLTDYGIQRKRHIRAGHEKRTKDWYLG